MHRTVRIKLTVPSGADSSFTETVSQFKWAANFTIRAACAGRDRPITSDRRLHDLTYHIVRKKTELQSNLVIFARYEAIRVLNRLLATESGQPLSRIPEIKSDYLVYGSRSATFTSASASLSTVDGRIEVSYVFPPDTEGTPHQKYLTNDNYRVTGATMHPRNGDWFLHLGMAADKSSVKPSSRTGLVLGVDLNVTGSLAVTSTGRFIESADQLNHRRNSYEQRRASLHRTDTQSAHRSIASIGSRFARYSSDLAHSISRQLVDEALNYECEYIVLEDLTGINDRMSSHPKFQHWFYDKLLSCIRYKAADQGLKFHQVDPAYTSATCSRCDSTTTNRVEKQFECLDCGYQLDADYNAAKNIGLKFVRRAQTPHGGRATRRLALKSGSVNENGEYTPTSVEA